MSIFTLTCIFSFITSSGVGLIFFLKGGNRRLNSLLGLTFITSSLFTLGAFKMSLTQLQEIALFWGKIAHIGIILSPAFYFNFILRLTKNTRKWLIGFVYVMAGIFLVLNFFDRNFLNLRFIFDEFYFFSGDIWKNPQYVAFYIIFYWIVLLSSFVVLLRFFKKTVGSKRQQIKYLMLGSIIGWLAPEGMFLSVLGLPLYPYSNILIGIYPLIFAYAIFKYRLLDINIFIKKSAWIAGAGIVVCGTLYLSGGLLQSSWVTLLGSYARFGPIGTSMISTAFLIFFIHYVFRLKDEELDSETKQRRERLARRTKLLARVKTRKQLSTLIVEAVLEEYNLDFCCAASRKKEIIFKGPIPHLIPYYVIEEIREKSEMKTRDHLRGKRIENDSNLVKYVKKIRKPLDADQLKNEVTKFTTASKDKVSFTKLIKEMEGLDSALIVPSFAGRNLVGFLVLGRKLDGKPFSLEDIDFFNQLATEAAKPINDLLEGEERIDLFLASIQLLLNAIDAKDHYTRGHTGRTKDYASWIAQDEEITGLLEKYPDAERELNIASELHDLGKLSISEVTLNTPNKLTPEQWEEIKLHPEESLKVVLPIAPWLGENIIAGILQHHENYNGTGYPKGLKNDKIHIYASIIHVSDAFDAMISKRPYRKKTLSPQEAFKELIKNKGTQFHPQVVDAFLRVAAGKELEDMSEEANPKKIIITLEMIEESEKQVR